MVPLTMALGGSPSRRGCALNCDWRASSFGRMGEMRHGHGEQDSNGIIQRAVKNNRTLFFLADTDSCTFA